VTIPLPEAEAFQDWECPECVAAECTRPLASHLRHSPNLLLPLSRPVPLQRGHGPNGHGYSDPAQTAITTSATRITAPITHVRIGHIGA
jgi:hypothetical protein